jgi:hypothetical protein
MTTAFVSQPDRFAEQCGCVQNVNDATQGSGIVAKGDEADFDMCNFGAALNEFDLKALK